MKLFRHCQQRRNPDAPSDQYCTLSVSCESKVISGGSDQHLIADPKRLEDSLRPASTTGLTLNTDNVPIGLSGTVTQGILPNEPPLDMQVDVGTRLEGWETLPVDWPKFV